MTEPRDVEEILFASYSKRQLIGWARSLNYFRYYRLEPGGKEPVPDNLFALFSYDTCKGLKAVLEALGALRPVPASSRVHHILQYPPFQALRARFLAVAQQHPDYDYYDILFELGKDDPEVLQSPVLKWLYPGTLPVVLACPDVENPGQCSLDDAPMVHVGVPTYGRHLWLRVILHRYVIDRRVT